MQKINEVKCVDSLTKFTAKMILRIYFLQMMAVLLSLLFGDQGFYGFIYKILLFGQNESISANFQYFFLGFHLAIFPSILVFPKLMVILKLYPYVLSVPLFIDSLQSLDVSNPLLSAVCVINLGLNVTIVRVSYLLYMSYAFLSSQDYLADRNLWWVKIVFPFGLAGARYFNAGLIGGFAVCVLSAMLLIREMFEFNYEIKHRGCIEMAAMMMFTSMMWLAYNFSGSQEKFATITLIIVFGMILSYILTEEMVDFGKHQSVYNSDFKTFKKCEDTVRYMFEVRRQFNQEKKSKKKYFGIIANHLQLCLQSDCKCKTLNLAAKQSINTFFNQLMLDILSKPNDNLTEQRIVLIYYFMQIISQPFRAYFQATKLTKEKLSILNKMEVMMIARQARFKVDVLLKQKKAINQDLKLHKVQDFQKKLLILKEKFTGILRQLISFLQLYTLKSLSISQMQDCATELNHKRSQIDSLIEQLHKINPNSKSLISMIKLYYQYFDIYDSKISKYDKLRHDFTMEQRLFRADEKLMFDEDHGIITINLSQNQGKIQYVSKNVAALFKMQPDEMLGANIETYMPDQHGRHHASILRNFIEKGSVRVLNEINVFFGRSTNMFIFPIELKIKIQTHENFQSTALVRNINSKSGFILLGENGRCQQITQGLYKQLFFQMFEDDLYKLRQVKLKSFMPELYRSDLQLGELYSAYILMPDNSTEFGTSRQTSEIGKTMLGTATMKSNSVMQGTVEGDNSQGKFQLTKWFDSVNFMRQQCYKVKFKLSKIRSSYFETTVVEIESIKECVKERVFFRRLFASLAHLCEKMGLNQYRVKMLAAQRAVRNLQQESELQILDGINLEFDTNNSDHQDVEESLGSEQSDQESLGSNKSEEISDESQQMAEEQSLGEQSQKSSISSVDYNVNKKQLVIDGFRKNTNSDYESIRKMIYFFVAIAILLKFLSLAEKLMFATYQNNEDISNSYLQKLSRSFYYYCAFREVAVFYSNDTIYYPVFKNQTAIQEKYLISEWKTNQKLNQDERQIFGFDTVLKPTSIMTVQPNLAREYMDFIKVLNQISIQAAVAVQSDTFTPQFLRSNLIELFHIFQDLKSSYYQLKQKTIASRNSFSLYFTIGCEVIYLIFFAVSIPIYMFYNSKKTRLLQFMGNFPSRVIKAELKFFRSMESKMLDEEPTGDQSEQDDFSVEEGKGLLSNMRRPTTVQKEKQPTPNNGKMKFNDVKDNKNSFIFLVLGFFVLYSILNWAIWALAYVYGLQSIASLETQVNFNQLGIQTPLTVYTFVSNMNNVNNGGSIDQKLLDLLNHPIYHSILTEEFKRFPKTDYITDTTAMMIKGYCPGCPGILSKGYFDNVKTIYQKLWYFAQNNFTTFTPSQIRTWAETERLSQLSMNLVELRDWVLELYNELQKSTASAYTYYWTLTILFIIANSILTAILGYFMQKSYIDEICVMINRAESLFKNLSVAVITENGALLNYFREKLRKK